MVGGDALRFGLGNSDGDFSFVSTAAYSVLEIFGNNSVAYGDFNGDGNLDLAYAAIWGPHDEPQTGMAASMGNGDDTFDPVWRLTDTSSVYVAELAAGDFNRDGKLDLAGGNTTNTSVFLGNGDGTFQLTTTYSGEGGVNLVTGDFNGDGILDLLFYEGETGQGAQAPISIAFGNGDGTFRKPVTIATPNGIGCEEEPTILVSDFNGDGNLDVAFCSDMNIGILLGNGDGTFKKPTSYYARPSGQFSFVAGDFNSDGETDILVSDYSQHEIAVLLGNGDGTLQSRTQVRVPGGPYNGGETGIVTGDFNSDGLLDFIFETDGSINIFLQQ